MSVVFSGTTQGVFTQVAGNPAKILQIREGVDWIRTYNQTQIAANAASTGYEFYYQFGMASGTGIEYRSNAGATAVDTTWLTVGGFTLVTNTVNTPGASVALTSISGATPPLVTVTPALLAGQLNNGDIVRIFNTTGAQQLGSIDFTIGAVTPGGAGAGTFTLAYMRAIVAATAGTYRRIPYDPYFYPPTRVISEILNSTLNGANVAIVSFTVTHNYTVGQKIRFLIPTVNATAFGMTALNRVEATILAIGASGGANVNNTTNTITVDVDVSAMTAFAWPVTANGAFTPAQVVPVGENTAQALTSGVNPFQDAEINQGYIGISLAGGTDSPAGVSGDVIYWVAGKSFNGQ